MSATQQKRIREPKPDHVMIARRVIATVLLPWLAAKFLLKPRVGPLRKDRLLDRLAFWRAVVGLFVIVVVTSNWRSTGAVMESATEKTVVTAVYAACAVSLPFLVLLIATRSGYRTQLLRGALRLLGRAALASTGLLLLFGMFIVFDGHHGPPQKAADLLPIAGIFAGTSWLIVLLACSFYWAARTGFWLSEVHPLLAPVGTTCVMLVITGQDLIRFDTEGSPAALWLTLNLCGAVTALALSVYEYRHLRSIGYRFRAGPQPAAMDDDQTHRPGARTLDPGRSCW